MNRLYKCPRCGEITSVCDCEPEEPESTRLSRALRRAQVACAAVEIPLGKSAVTGNDWVFLKGRIEYLKGVAMGFTILGYEDDANPYDAAAEAVEELCTEIAGLPEDDEVAA